MRKRIEDLGRLYVLLEALIDRIEEEDAPRRPKDGVDWFFALDKETQEDFIEALCYKRQMLLDGLQDMCSIARGDDDLNCSLDENMGR